MQTARDIAQLYAPDMAADLELAILRHMERHGMEVAKVERERCAKLLESHESPYDNTAHYYARIIRENEQPA